MTSSPSKLNPRFEIYAKAHGRTGEEQLAYDKEAWPGGCMVGFMQWMRPHIEEFNTLKGWPGSGAIWPAEFDAFLDKKAEEQLASRNS